MLQIVLATTNAGKVREFAAAFSHLPVALLPLSSFGAIPEPVEDGARFEENAEIKARYYMEKTGIAALADDSGLEVEALDFAPGVHSARYAGAHGDDDANNEKLVRELAAKGLSSSPAAYRCALCLALPSGEFLTAEGASFGEVRVDGRGAGGFGYDPFFYVGERSYAELSLEEKQEISHRGRAIAALSSRLEVFLK